MLEKILVRTRSIKKLVSAIRKALGATRKLSILTSNETPSLVLSKNFTAMSDEIRKEIDKIPTQTTRCEREFLYNFFASQWNGCGDVIEIGPFLGGSTRMIALGMSDNPQKGSESCLHTFDKFDNYIRFSENEPITEILINNGILQRSQIASGGKSSFQDVFNKLHQNEAYANLIKVHNKPLPDSRESLLGVNAESELFNISGIEKTTAVFIDGCKSWFGTKYFMAKIASICGQGTCFILQDYGWFTCFWLSAFMTIFKDNFRLLSRVDNTYTFMMLKSIREEEIYSKFPDTPEEIGAQQINQLYSENTRDHAVQQDEYTLVRMTLHHAAALAYIGEQDSAISIIEDLRLKTYSLGHEDVIKAARRSPTYRPDRKILLS